MVSDSVLQTWFSLRRKRLQISYLDFGVLGEAASGLTFFKTFLGI